MMSNYNHAQFIPEALDSILTQSYQPLEVVIIDDGSTDDSLAVLDRYRQRHPELIRVVKNGRNFGVMHNAPRLVSMAAGDYVFFASLDDRILPGFFERSMSVLARHPTAGLCSTLSRIIGHAGQDQGLVQMAVVRDTESYLGPIDVLAALRLHRSWFMGNTTVYRRDALVEAGGFIAELGSYCDGFISLVLALKHGACFIPEPLAVWRRSDNSYSRRISMNVAATLAISQALENLIQTRYRDLFPPDYALELKQDLFFGAAASYVATSGDDKFEGLERLIPNPRAVDAFFLWILRTWPGFGRKIAKPYFFIRMRRRHFLRTMGRKLTYLLRPPFRTSQQ